MQDDATTDKRFGRPVASSSPSNIPQAKSTSTYTSPTNVAGAVETNSSTKEVANPTTVASSTTSIADGGNHGRLSTGDIAAIVGSIFGGLAIIVGLLAWLCPV